MKRITLIANSGIQYIKFSAEIDKNFDTQPENEIYYRESFDNNTEEYILDPLLKYIREGETVYYRSQQLYEKDFITNGHIKEDIDLSILQEIDIDKVYKYKDLDKALKTFQRKWIPLPYFKNNAINKNILFPTDWVRVFIDGEEKEGKIVSAKIILAVDTLLAHNEEDKTSPQLILNEDESIFKLETSPLNIANILSDPHFASSWIDKYLEDIYYEKNKDRLVRPYKRYIANYIILIKWLSSLMQIPEIELLSDKRKKKEVDLVIDIGNSATCALLFENKDDNTFNFESVKKLIIQDYTYPDKQYAEPFPMNVVFSESKFGEINDTSDNKKFTVPSLVRIGWEAEHLISSLAVDLSRGRELKAYNSSPKRYLWDDSPSEHEWEFNPKDSRSVKKVYLNGITNQIRNDGELLKGNEVFMSKPLFSRKSLMKFVFLEILVHAYTQINSYEFREEHGDMRVPRTLKRITISCPTAMIQAEQVALRQAAEEACKLLKNYAAYYFEDENYKDFWFEEPEIIPATKDIEKNLFQIEERKDWNYDEANCCQLVFLYSLIIKKLKGDNYVIDNYLFKGKNTIKVASIDIGAGTTDILINQYQLKENGKGSDLLTPTPLFWDSFRFAGDDLLRDLIQKIIIEGEEQDEQYQGCSGVIENYGKRQGITNMSERLNGFFGENANNIGQKEQIGRQFFVHQVAIPIIMEYLKSANNPDEQSQTKTFEEIIGKKFLNKELLKYFEMYFGFSLLDIPWQISPKRVNMIVSSVFDALIRQICVVFNQYQCDFVVLSGKPASLHSFEELFKKYLTISPSNLINLNNYWVGRWYPFSDNNGFISDPKTVVSVGAIVALMSGKLFKIQDLRLDTRELTQKLISTADYIIRTTHEKEAILTPKKNENQLIVSTIPFHFGYSKYLSKNYPYADLYSIRFNDKEIKANIRKSNPSRDEAYIDNQLGIEKTTIRQNLPLKIQLVREYDSSKEVVRIESVEDSEGNKRPSKYFIMHYQTLEDEKGYWLDKCEFILNIK